MDTNEGKGLFVAWGGKFEQQKFDNVINRSFDSAERSAAESKDLVNLLSFCFSLSLFYSVSIAVTTALSSAHRILRASASVCLAVRGRSRLAVRPVENLS